MWIFRNHLFVRLQALLTHVVVDTAGWHSRSVFSSRYLQTFPEISASVEGEQFAGRGEQEEQNTTQDAGDLADKIS